MNKRFAIVTLIFCVAVGIFSASHYQLPLSKQTSIERNRWADSRFVNVNGIKAHYRDVGEGEVVVQFHGNGANLYHYTEVIEALSQQYRVIAVEYIGHGLTGANHNNNYSNEAFLGFIEAFIERIELNRFALIGHSFGGYLSMLYAQRNPEKVEKVILLNSYGGICKGQEYGVPFVPENLPLAETFAAYFLPKFMVRRELETMVVEPESITNELVDAHYSILSMDGNRLYRKYFFDFEHARAAIEGDLLSLPIYMVWGDKDNVHSLCEMQDLQQRVAITDTMILKDIGHLPNIENPMDTQKALMAFLQQ